ncbi:MAG: hypothetical protein ABL866_12645 [Devosia sp.]
MRNFLLLALLLLPSPAFAQFPPTGFYDCLDAAKVKLGVLTLQAGGEYQWDADGVSLPGQFATSGAAAEAVTGVLAEKHWRGLFFTVMGATRFTFETDAGQVKCE